MELCHDFFFKFQGDLEEAHKDKDHKCVFLTVHDVGTNHSIWEHLIDHETFEAIKKRAIFVHVDVPGQEDHAENLPNDFHFPTMQHLGKDFSKIKFIAFQTEIGQMFTLIFPWALWL